MCTSISWLSRDHYFGRNLDLEQGFGENVVITPRNYTQAHSKAFPTNKYAMIGMATVIDGYPLYYEATNECGLSMAGLNFPGNAHYVPPTEGRDNIPSFALIPWLLGRCQNTQAATSLLRSTVITNEAFSPQLPASPLHWIISDRKQSVVVEQTTEGLKLYDDPVGVLTNNPPFPYHQYNLANYMSLSPEKPVNRMSGTIELTPYSLGMGALGLPGDLSSGSRYVRAAYTKLNATTPETEDQAVSQFFHILDTVAQTDGCTKTPIGFEKTLYSSCCNTVKGIYYYTTYDNRQITGIKMTEASKTAAQLQQFPLRTQQSIHFEN